MAVSRPALGQASPPLLGHNLLRQMDLSRGASHGGRDVTASVRARCGRADEWQNIRTVARRVWSEAPFDACKSGISFRGWAFLMLVECCAFGYANRASKGSGIRLSHSQTAKFGSHCGCVQCIEEAGSQSSDVVCSYFPIFSSFCCFSPRSRTVGIGSPRRLLP